MKVLLDTNAFLAIAFDHKLPPGVRRLVAKQTTEVLISVVTPWEIAIKNSVLPAKRGKPGLSSQHVEHAMAEMGARLLSVRMEHVARLEELAFHHGGDPFDRMIIAQALEEGCPVISADQRFPEYARDGLRVMWK